MLLCLNRFPSPHCKGSALLWESHLLTKTTAILRDIKGSMYKFGIKEGQAEGRICMCTWPQHSCTREGTAMWTCMPPKPETGTLHLLSCPIFKAKYKAGFPFTPTSHHNTQRLSATYPDKYHLQLNCTIFSTEMAEALFLWVFYPLCSVREGKMIVVFHHYGEMWWLA